MPSSAPAPRPGRQHERRLLAAFDAIDLFPCLQASRDRVLGALGASPVEQATVIAVVESDVGLAMRMLREARRVVGRTPVLVGTIPEAAEILGPDGMRAVAEVTPTVDFFARSGGWGAEPFDYRRHVAAVQAAIHRVVQRTSIDALDRLMAGAVLHDIGKLVLQRAHAGYVDHPVPDQGTPEQRLVGERRATGIDHALVGGVLVRRWGLSGSLARLVECHHVEDPNRDAEELTVLRLADMLAHFGSGDAVSPPRMAALARRLGLDRGQLRDLLYEQHTATAAAPRDATPNPLSPRETEVLACLAEGLVYKQIAGRLDLATSTVRTHLHNIYFKLGAVDRAQAVLIAVRSGWI
ncbi:MAG: HDOD domain-containing protein [Patulibacter sp.]|nr:HDOD domain-containing protein [Patulibacter sp.]